MTAGLFLLVLGLLWTAFNGYVVWSAARDRHGGGGVPTLDFALICPLPLAFGISLILAARESVPFTGFGFVLCLGLVGVLGVLHWLFERSGQSGGTQ